MAAQGCVGFGDAVPGLERVAELRTSGRAADADSTSLSYPRRSGSGYGQRPERLASTSMTAFLDSNWHGGGAACQAESGQRPSNLNASGLIVDGRSSSEAGSKTRKQPRAVNRPTIVSQRACAYAGRERFVPSVCAPLATATPVRSDGAPLEPVIMPAASAPSARSSPKFSASKASPPTRTNTRRTGS